MASPAVIRKLVAGGQHRGSLTPVRQNGKLRRNAADYEAAAWLQAIPNVPLLAVASGVGVASDAASEAV